MGWAARVPSSTCQSTVPYSKRGTKLHVLKDNYQVLSSPRNGDSLPLTLVNVESWQDVFENLLIVMGCDCDLSRLRFGF